FLSNRHVEARLPQRGRERAERVPVERFRREPALVLVDVPRRRRPAELVAQLAEQAEQLLARREAPRDETGRALGRVPRAEVLDHGLWMDSGLRVGGELPHRRRAPEPFRAGGDLGDDLLVRVALADAGLELRQLLA